MKDGEIQPEYTCGGGTVWFPLKWGPVPSGTKELVLYIGRYKDKTVDSSGGVEVPFGTMVAHISPKVRSIPIYTFPEGVIPVSYKSFNSCGIKPGETYLVKLFALDREKPIPAGTTELKPDFVTSLTEEALVAGQFAEGSKSATELTEDSLATGQFTAALPSG